MARQTNVRPTMMFRQTIFGHRGGRNSEDGRNSNPNIMRNNSRTTMNGMPMLPSSTPLEERLHQIQVYEIREDGESDFDTMTLRSLYNYVVTTITNGCKQTKKEKLAKSHMNASPATRKLQVVDEPKPKTKGVSFAQDTIPEMTNPPSPPSSANQGSNEKNGKHRERLGGYIHPRDMRRLVTPFSASNEPSLMIRRHVMLLNFDPLRAIVLKDRMLVLVPDGDDSICFDLERRVRGGIVEMENQVFGSVINETMRSPTDNNKDEPTTIFGKVINTTMNMMNKSSASNEAGDKSEASTEDMEEDNEWQDILNMEGSHMAFELQSVDSILQTVTSMLMNDAMLVHERAVQSMSELRGDSKIRRGGSLSNSGLNENAQERLRIHKDEIKEMEGRVQGFVRAVNDVLDDDEHMTLMNLSRLLSHPERFMKPVSREILHEESNEPELILEAYMQQSLSIVNELDLLKGQITTTEEQISMMLDAIRNRLLYINTLISVAAFCVGAGSFVASTLGMNLTNHLEDDDDVFLTVVVATVVGMIILWIILSVIFYKAANTSDLIKKNQ